MKTNEQNRLMKGAVWAGLAGAAAVVLASRWLAFNDLRFALDETYRTARELQVLAFAGGVMFAVELLRRWRLDPEGFFRVSPRLARPSSFLLEGFGVFVVNHAALLSASWAYRHLNEYGYASGAAYYQSWFRLLEIVLHWHLLAGLPYVLLTRAFQHDTVGDSKELSVWVLKRGAAFLEFDDPFPDVRSEPRIMALSLLVKAFFTPLMTVFFHDQFKHMVSNWVFLAGPNVGQDAWKEAFDVGTALIYGVDVALAWAGYVGNTRWIRSYCVSVEPTLSGWTVALLCYPPIRSMFGAYFSTPDEHEVLQFASGWVKGPCVLLYLMSGTSYVLSTAWFGMRFSNLTHRGLITTGPYGLVRHPAYASKNTAWWLVMFPMVFWKAAVGRGTEAAVLLLGLSALSALYYMRALTEERHLSADPAYQDYCRAVPDRFFPFRLLRRASGGHAGLVAPLGEKVQARLREDVADA